MTLTRYGRRERCRVAECQARVYAAPDRSLRIVAVEPLTGGRTRQAFYSTLQDASAEQGLAWYAMRWSIEETFHEAKGQLGFEEPQGWTRKVVERTGPTAMLRYSLIVQWFAREGHRRYRAAYRPWYAHEAGACFADMLNTLRAQSVRAQVLSLPVQGRGHRKLVKSLLHAIQQAA